MEGEKKKLAVISAAVTAYMEAERQARVPPKPPAKIHPSAWGFSARQEMMSGRIMMQRKVYR